MGKFTDEGLNRIGFARKWSVQARLIHQALAFLALLSLGCLLATPGWATTTVLLNANFNDKPLNTPIGSGGPTVGEPISVDSFLDARVQAAPLATPSLHLWSLASSSSVRYLAFELLGGAEIQTGQVRVAFTLRAPAVLSQLNVIIREQGSTADSFGSLTFTAAGTINTSDASGQLANIRAYAAGETMDVEYFYHLDVGTYDLRINNVLLLDNRPHGVTDPAEGIGRLSFGTNGTQEWAIDDIAITHTTPNTVLLDANFNDKPLDVQIGTGGPAVGEPISLFPGLSAIVRSAPLATPSLHLSQSGTGVARSARFQFLDADEVKRGQLRTAFTIRTPTVLDSFQVRLLDPQSNIRMYGGVDFTTSGLIRTNDSLSSNVTVASYAPGQTLRFEFVHQMVAGTYDLYINGALVLDDRFYNPPQFERGIGVITAGLLSNSTQAWVFDDLRVERAPHLLDADFNDQALDQQIGTAGAAAGQPVNFSSAELVAEPRTGLFPTVALALEQTTMGSAKSARFEMLDSAEVTQGELRISLRVLPPSVNDSLNVYIREQGGSGQSFGSLQFLSGGTILTSDVAGSETFANYLPGVEQRFEYRYHMDSGTYDVYVDRVQKVFNRSWGATAPGRGIGRVTVGTTATSAQRWVVDDLYVYQPNDVLFANGFD